MAKDYVRIEQERKEKLNRVAELQAELETLYTQPGIRPRIGSPADAAKLVLTNMSMLDREELWVIVLDNRNGVKSIEHVYRRSVNCSNIRIAEVFREAVVQYALSIVVCHNHPTGDPTPSPEDVAVTRSMVQAGKLLDIEVLDYLVIAGGRFTSLKERGLGF